MMMIIDTNTFAPLNGDTEFFYDLNRKLIGEAYGWGLKIFLSICCPTLLLFEQGNVRHIRFFLCCLFALATLYIELLIVPDR